MNTTITFDKQYLDDLEANNYFGSGDQDEITELREAWVEEMGRLGFEPGNEYDIDEFDPGEEALTSALQRVTRK